MCREFTGTSEIIEASGWKLLNNFPLCKDLEHLSKQLDKWLTFVGDNGRDIATYAPKQLRVRLIEILPAGLEDEMEHPLKSRIVTVDHVVEWCRARTTKSRQKLLAAPKLKHFSSATTGGRMSPLVQEPQTDHASESIPQWAEPLTAALKKGNDRCRDTRKPGDRRLLRSRTPSPSTRSRTASPSDFKPQGKLIWRRGCSHCSDTGHQREDAKSSLPSEAWW